MQIPVSPVRPDEIDLRQVFAVLRRAALPIFGTTLLIGGATYAYTRQQPKIYTAVSSVLAAQDASQNSLINNTLVTAPPLPQGAVEEALHSRSVVNDISGLLAKSVLPPVVVTRIQNTLTREIADQSFVLLKVKARLDPQQRGVYEISSSAESPLAAQILADAGVHALLAWDTGRAQSGVKRAKNSLEAQIRDLDARITMTAASSVDRQGLISARGQVQQNLAQIAVFEQAASGPLTLVAEANQPRTPVSPRPLRDTALAALLALFLASGAALFLDSFRRRVNGLEDLTEFGYPVLAQLPALKPKGLSNGIVAAARSGALYEAVGFLRLNILNAPRTGERVQRRIVISSAGPGEGKSSVTAVLADALATTGLKVLVIDADLYRPTQQRLWRFDAAQQVAAPPLLVSKPDVPGAQPLLVERNVFLIPAGSHGGAAGIIHNPSFPERFDRWTVGYDVVLIDTPPLVNVSDALAVAALSDGLIFVLEAGRTREREVQNALRNIRVANVPMLGFVLNKQREASSGYYDYGYTSTRTEVSSAK